MWDFLEYVEPVVVCIFWGIDEIAGLDFLTWDAPFVWKDFFVLGAFADEVFAVGVSDDAGDRDVVGFVLHV